VVVPPLQVASLLNRSQRAAEGLNVGQQTVSFSAFHGLSSLDTTHKLWVHFGSSNQASAQQDSGRAVQLQGRCAGRVCQLPLPDQLTESDRYRHRPVPPAQVCNGARVNGGWCTSHLAGAWEQTGMGVAETPVGGLRTPRKRGTNIGTRRWYAR